MDGSVEMRARVLDHTPPEQIEAVLLEVELPFHVDAGLAHKGRKFRRHRMRQVHHLAEASGFRGSGGHRRCRKSGCCRPGEKTAPAQGRPDPGFTPSNAHFFCSAGAYSRARLSLAGATLATGAVTQAAL